MKYFLILFLLIFISSCSKPTKNCTKFKTGTFIFADKKLKGLKVERNDSIQIEIDETKGSKVICKIKWLTECKYLITPIESINRKDSTNLVTAEVDIIETSHDSYTFISIINDTIGYKYKMKKIK